MNFTRIYGLFLRHFYLITRSFPRILDLIYWRSIQITLLGLLGEYVGVILLHQRNMPLVIEKERINF